MGGNVDNCAVTAGTISNFENQSLDVATHNGWTGAWEAFKGAGGTHTMAVEKWGTETCNQYALHTRGSGVTQYVGIGVNLTGTPTQPTVYNGSAWTGVRFKARLGGATTSAVRFNISTPWTEGSENPGGLCTGTGCYNHVGRFLHQENALTNDWKQFTFCFDRDLYPQFLPSNLSATQRRQVASNILKLQFVFNVAKNLSQSPPAEYAKTEPFDFWLDDIELVADSCDTRPQPFTSSSGTAKPFPQNGAAGTVGSCTRATDANKFSHTIAEAYLRWKTNFVRAGNPGQRVLSPEQGDDTPSEAMGYGMLIAAAMGDKAMFDQFWTYVNSQLVSGLMKWSRNGNGSATDADQDIAYALALGASQWGGDYAARATTMINAISSRDLQAGNRIGPGSDWGSTPAFNASYVAPSYYPVFQALTGSSTWATIKSANYTNVSNCTQWFSGGTLPADWCNVSTSQAVPGENFGAAVLSFPGVAVYAFDAARVPWRVALDACLFDSSTARSYLNTLVGFFTSRYTNGETIDRMLAGWRSDLTAHPNAQENQMSFIGPVGVAAMATTHTATRERAFRAVLDIMENPEFNRTYYPTTVGLITLLQMSGNFPHRTN
jgi:endo-1,4-beta-D-glucanase Y